MKISIFGGGITGCISALKAISLGHEVILYEKLDKLGGHMADLWSDDECFLNNCHYFEEATPWFKEVKDKLSCSFIDFEHNYSSFNQLDNSDSLNDYYAQPVFDCKFIENDYKFLQLDSVLDHINSYPPYISTKLIKWASNFGPLGSIHHSCIYPMQIGRVMLKQNIKEVFLQKQSNKVIDRLLGLPWHYLDPLHSKIVSSLPNEGFDNFFNILYAFLRNLGCKIKLSTNVRVSLSENNKIKYYLQDKTEVLSDKYIWTGNPTPIINKFSKLKPNITKTLTIVGHLNDSIVQSPSYYQIFSNKLSLNRLYIYNLKSSKFTIEAFDRGLSLEDLTSEISYLLKFLKLGKYQISLVSNQKRFNYLSIHDYHQIVKFNQNHLERNNLLNSYWHLYSRDIKIEKLVKQISLL